LYGAIEEEREDEEFKDDWDKWEQSKSNLRTDWKIRYIKWSHWRSSLSIWTLQFLIWCNNLLSNNSIIER
jgi:hypothetical protein